MKRKEANALEEQLLKQKMDELHKKLHQVVEMSQENLPSSQGTSEVCRLLPIASHAHCSDFCWCLSLLCSILRVNSDVSLVTSFPNYSPPPHTEKWGERPSDTLPARMEVTLQSQESETLCFSVPAQGTVTMQDEKGSQRTGCVCVCVCVCIRTVTMQDEKQSYRTGWVVCVCVCVHQCIQSFI